MFMSFELNQDRQRSSIFDSGSGSERRRASGSRKSPVPALAFTTHAPASGHVRTLDHGRICPDSIAAAGPGRHWQALSRVLLSVLVLMLSACAVVEPLDTQPFLDYQSAVSSLKDSSDQAIEVVYQEEFDQFKARIESGESGDVRQLMLDFPPGSSFGWAYPGSNGQPIFIGIANMRETLAAMNAQLLDYTSLLLALASADQGTDYDAAAQAEKFNSDAGGLLQRLDSLGVGVGDVGSRDVALFSTAAANLAAAYLENKRVELLTEILDDGLAPMQAFVEKAQEAMVLTAANAKTHYQDERTELVDAVVSDGSSSALDKLLALNERITQRLALYKNIHDGYGALPNAQRRIITAVKESRDPSLGELLSYVANVKAQFEDLEDGNGSKASGD